VNSIRRTDRPIREVNDLQSILRQLTRSEDKFIHAHNKRRVFNVIGGISKILFGTLDTEDANYYTDKISKLENEQLDFLKLSKEQITVVKSTLRSVNSTLLTVSENERCLTKGLEEMAKRINVQNEEIKEMFGSYSLILTINKHSMQLSRAVDECCREYEILIDAVVNSHKGVIQPQLITPAQIFE
jgi:methyl-accepting chemotaxis protein